MSNLPVQPDDEANEHLLQHSLGIAAGTDVGDEMGLDAEQIIEHVLADPHVTQHVTRTSRAGVDSLAGYFRCDFVADQERAILHVPIVPPLVVVPQVEAMAVESAARIRITDTQKFGIRIEVVRSGAGLAAESFMVEVIATADEEQLQTPN